MTLKKISVEIEDRICYLNQKLDEAKEKRIELRIGLSLTDQEIDRLPRNHPFNKKDYALLEQMRKIEEESRILRSMILKIPDKLDEYLYSGKGE